MLRTRTHSTRRLVVAGLATAAVVVGLVPALGGTASAARFTPWSTSFEAGQPAPDWTSTAETLPDGSKKESGIDGSVVTGIPGSVNSLISDVAAKGENPPGEVAANLTDADPSTKWLDFESTSWVTYTLSKPVVVTTYALTSANDHPERDPADWQLQGSSDGSSWTTIDTQTGQAFADRGQTKTYQAVNTTAYDHYRLNVTKNGSGDIVQLADWQLSNGDTTPPPAQDMQAVVGGGPTSSYNAKNGAGFTGTHSLHYAGRITGANGGYAWDKLFAVHIPVQKTTELSYNVFPELTDQALDYRSTYVAVDLHFTDGTYLSDLKATDIHGMAMSPRGQGAAKALYANQWNHVQSTIGTVAAGKTIDRILIGYDSPTKPANFGGWLDDIALAQAQTADAGAHPSDWAVTTRGTNSSGNFSRGNNFPATAMPHGFNFWTPMTDASSQSFFYSYAASNNADNEPTIQAFEASHEPSPWMGDRQTFQVMPSAASGTPDADRTARALPFQHKNEDARPNYYGVTFDNGLKTEIVPTDHGAVMKFTFTGKDENLIFDNVNNSGGLTIDAAKGTVTGYSDVNSGAGATRLFVYGTFDRPISASGSLTGGGGDNVTGYARFDSTVSHVVTMKITTSLISVAQAKHNMDLEIPASSTFSTVKNAAQRAWDKQLGVIDVKGATTDQLTTLYSDLYRINLYPNSGFENTGTASAPVYEHASPVMSLARANTPTRTGAHVMSGKIYVNNGFWDTYRTEWPMLSFLYPKQAGELLDGFVKQFTEGGWIARWSSPGYADLMTGTSSDVAFADAYNKGVPGIDIKDMYAAAVKNATTVSGNSAVGRKGIDSSIFLGYTPTSTAESVSWGLDGYVNDFGIAMMSKKLYDGTKAGDPDHQLYADNYRYFLNRSQNYVKIFNSGVGFFEGKDASGQWRLPDASFDPEVWGNEYTETDAWGFAFTVPQDGQGLADLYGGKAGLAKKLDEFFATPETALKPGSYGGTIHEMREARDVRMGQWGVSNQPAHHIPYMYDYAGQPYKAQAIVREAEQRLFTGSTIGEGYPGDEDNGEMSAWRVFGALGFYPLQMGSPNFAVGSPLFTKATVHLENGKDLVINAPDNSATNVYVQSLKVNGKAWSSTSLPSDLLAKGGRLDFGMGAQPSAWGTGANDAPTSITTGDTPPTPDADQTGGTAGTATASDGTSTAALFDNTSDTQSTFTDKRPTLTYRFVNPKTQITSYTLTSGTAKADPSAWTLQGSADGTHWTTLDDRRAVSFDWRQQTKPFTVAKPGTYGWYRLKITGHVGSGVTLAEVELLGQTPAPLSDSNYVKDYLAALDLGDLSAVKENLPLPASGDGVTVGWTSSDTSVMRDDGVLVMRPAVGQPDAHLTLTVTVTKGASSGTKTFQVVVPAWTQAEMTYGAGTDLTTGFESGQPQPQHNVRLWSTNVGEYCCGIGGMETAPGSGMTHTGSGLLLFSGQGQSATHSTAGSTILDSSGIWVKPSTTLSYWIYPQHDGQDPVSTTSTHVGMDILFTDGTYLHDLGDAYDPDKQAGTLTADSYNQVTLDVGKVAEGKQIEKIVLDYNCTGSAGYFRGFVDDLSIAHQASS